MPFEGTARTEEEYGSLNGGERAKRIIMNTDEESFRKWYRERIRTRNIQEGTPYFNGPSPTPSPGRHSPSRLLQCHRRTYYQLHNAPVETRPPKGIYWFGSQFETDIILPFLRSLVSPEFYVRNSIWIDLKISLSGNKLHFKGETDPVIVDGDSQPQLLTEIKTTSSVQALNDARLRHKAQAHVYMYGLSQQYETSVEEAVIVYGDRKTFDVRSFHVPFDPDFWDGSVLEWAEENSQYRRNEELPPGNPEVDWECNVCPFQHRCGKSDGPYRDVEPFGLLPRFEEYPKERVGMYLRAHSDVKLTPTLAYRYPDLADEHGFYNWQCSVCSRTYSVHEIEWDGDLDHLPLCPACCNDGTPVPLSGPPPAAQQSAKRAEEENNALG